MTPHEFIRKWSRSTLKERSAAQEHFVDLCRVLGEPTPADADPRGEWYCFEKGARKTGGGDGWADVWRRSCFAWEYKGKKKDLDTAFTQLQRYAIALENPPLLVVSDMKSIEIHTNFTNTVSAIHTIHIADLGESDNLRKLRALFRDPGYLRPGQTKAALTAEAAERFATLAASMHARGGDSVRVAHFLNRILFCLFAQHAGLLPSNLVVQVLESGLASPDGATQMLKSLFGVMKKGGNFGAHVIEWFNGNLFDSDDAIPLAPADIETLLSVSAMDWSAIEPSIFGTLFERGLDPEKRAQIGAHYTDAESITRIVQPAVLAPLEAKWAEEKRAIEHALRLAASDARNGRDIAAEAQKQFDEFLVELSSCRVLDPACGSGNFLYLSLQALKDFERAATIQAEELGLNVNHDGTRVGVECVHGIELNPVAAELARVTVWIGEIQWMLRHGIQPSKNPILKSLNTIECRDAVVTTDGHQAPWPQATAIVGNPPFLGNKRMLSELGAEYTERLRFAYRESLPGAVDLVAYWFERARSQVKAGMARRVGLVATQAIRKGANRTVLDRIAADMSIIEAWRDEPWINEGAAVRVSLIVFGEEPRVARLDGHEVDGINADLSPKNADGVDLTKAQRLIENRGVCFMGTSKVGAFEIPGDLARHWLKLPNPHGRSNADVIRPWANGQELTGRPADKWIIDFGVAMSERVAAMYEAPFAYLRKHVRPERAKQRRETYRLKWWIHAEARPGLRTSTQYLPRYIATPRVAKHRFFVWLPAAVLPDSRLFAISRADDTTFGILMSRLHCVWATANASRHGDGAEGGRPCYNAATCFETFPFPDLTEASRNRIDTAAIALDELRERWLNPPEWTRREAEIDPRFPERIMVIEGHETDIASRTLTDLYNERPPWLVQAHEDLDLAVAHAYGWNDYSASMKDSEITKRLLELNKTRSADLISAAARPTIASGSARFADVLSRRVLLAEAIVQKLRPDPNLGRTKLAKVYYLADMRAGLDLQMTYYREAAGPLDPRALYHPSIGIEALGRQRDVFHAKQDRRSVRYSLGRASKNLNERASKEFGSAWSEIARVIDVTRSMSTDQSEIVATLYACWNDLLLKGRPATDAAIISDFLTRWHEQKERFEPSRLARALDWMREKQLVPHGRGARTREREGPRVASVPKRARKSTLAAALGKRSRAPTPGSASI